MNISRSAYVRKIRDFFGDADVSALLRPGLWVNF